MSLNTLKNSYRYKKDRMSFRTRLFAAFFLVSVPVLIVISIFLYIFLSTSAEESTSKTMLRIMERTKGQIENVITNTEDLSRNIIYDADVQALFKEAYNGVPYPETGNVKYFINSFIVNRDYIESVVLIGNEDTLFSTERANTDVSSQRKIEEKWWYGNLSESDPFLWFTSAKTPAGKIRTPGALMLTRAVKSIDDYKTTVGRMMIYIKDSFIQSIWDDIHWGRTLNVWVYDSHGELMLHYQPGPDYTPYIKEALGTEPAEQPFSAILRFGGRRFAVGMETMEDNQWKMIMAVPLSEVSESRIIILVQLAAMVLLILIIVTIVSVIISKSLSTPVIQISKIMDSYHSNAGDNSKTQDYTLETAGFKQRTDEIGTIYRSYEQLAERVDTLIKEIYIKDLEKKDAELALMESQINPHFLYNTLDSINWMAMANGQDEISEMVTALSDTFRLSLKKTDSSYIQLSQEIEYLNSYLILQKYRFGGKLTYAFHIDEQDKSLFILRFILQPVVENGIKHGISHLEGGGHIDVYVIKEDGLLKIHVINDGSNIDISKMERLLQFDAQTQTFLSFEQNGYGLQNINRRIKIVHGPEYGVHFSITNNHRTKCTVTVPIVKEEQ